MPLHPRVHSQVCTLRHVHVSVKTKATHTPRDLVMTSAGVVSHSVLLCDVATCT